MGKDIWVRVLRSLEHPFRRRLLMLLSEHSPQSGAIQIPEDVHADEIDRERLHIEFEHVHLPLLAEYGYVTRDDETNRVSKGPTFDEIRPILELFVTHSEDLPAEWP